MRFPIALTRQTILVLVIVASSFIILTVKFSSVYDEKLLLGHPKYLKRQNNLNQSKDSSSYTGQPLPMEYNSVQQKLAQANKNWERSNFRRDIANASRFAAAWDSYYPSFDCPFTKERVGTAGDGGKWVCGMEELVKLNNFLIYSFGVKDDTSFEKEFANRTNCTVRLFDHTIKNIPSIVDLFPGRVTYAKYGLSTSKTHGELKSIQSVMKKYNDSFVDMLKVDIEGAEWDAMNHTVKSFPQGLPFAQLAIELHLRKVEDRPLEWWKMLDRAGLRAFNTEPNMFDPMHLSEYSFINIKNGPFKIKTRTRYKKRMRKN